MIIAARELNTGKYRAASDAPRAHSTRRYGYVMCGGRCHLRLSVLHAYQPEGSGRR